jgi:hypothetical protein
MGYDFFKCISYKSWYLSYFIELMAEEKGGSPLWSELALSKSFIVQKDYAILPTTRPFRKRDYHQPSSDCDFAWLPQIG